MPSIQSYIVNAYLRWQKYKNRHKAFSVEGARRRFDRIGRLIPLAPEVQRSATGANGIRIEYFNPPKITQKHTLLYLHGGGYVVGSMRSYEGLLAQIALATGGQVVAFEYAKAPERPFPSALSESLLVYEWLLKQGKAPEEIVLMGDSAGGGLCLSLLQKLQEEKLPMPARLVLIAPWADLTLQAPSITQKAKQDHIITREYLDIVRRLYVPDLQMLEHPLVSPIYANFEGFPPTLIQVGTNDLLYDDSIQLVEKMKTAGVAVDLEVWENMPHVWHVIGDRLPEAGKALQKIADFIRKMA